MKLNNAETTALDAALTTLVSAAGALQTIIITTGTPTNAECGAAIATYQAAKIAVDNLIPANPLTAAGSGASGTTVLGGKGFRASV